MKFQPNFYVLSLLLTTALATLTNLKNDIQTITSRVQSLNDEVTNFDNTGGSVTSATAIHSIIVNLGQDIDKGTTTSKTLKGPLSKSDAQPILESFEETKPAMLNILTQAVALKVVFANIVGPIGGTMILEDLKSINSSTSKLQAALISLTPNDLLVQASSITSSVNVAFATAIAVHSS